MKSGTALHRAHALSRLGHDVEICDPDEFLPKSPWSRRFQWETGALFINKHIDSEVIKVFGNNTYDVLWVDHGRYTGADLVRFAKSKGAKTVVMNVDDPFGYRDRLSWLTYRKTVKEFDLVVVFREPNIEENYRAGAADVMRVFMCADEVAHRRVELSNEESAKYSSDVLFVGTWMVGRGTFMKDLLDRNVPITIVGDRWNKAPEWEYIKKAWKAPGVYDERSYAAYIQSSKICIGLLSEQNRDLHTTRSSEIPAIGSLFCGQRTTEHMALYSDGIEAVFWNDSTECAERCLELLQDPEKIKEISSAGHKKCLQNATMNEPVMKSVLDRLMNQNLKSTN